MAAPSTLTLTSGTGTDLIGGNSLRTAISPGAHNRGYRGTHRHFPRRSQGSRSSRKMSSISAEVKGDLANMEKFMDNGKIVYEKYVYIEGAILSLNNTLTEIFEDTDHPKQGDAIQQIKDIVLNWTELVKIQRGDLNKMEQETLINAIEITGLPEIYAKDIEGVASILAYILHITIEQSYIVGFERLGKLVQGGPPRPLVVHLINENIKKRVLTVADMVQISIVGSDIPMEIVEHLTTYNKELLKKARQEALKHNINEVWVKDGKIFFKRGENSFTYEIQSEADLKQMSQF